jgi:hypothetical protein
MAEDLDNEFELLNEAVRGRDPNMLKSWEDMYNRWVHVDHNGTCPFETADALRCKFLTVVPS